MSIALHAFRPSVEKVYHIDVHPTQPWIASSDGGDNVVVWDWEHRQILYELNAGGVDERRLVDVQLQRMADGDEQAKSRSAATGGEAIRGGNVKDVKFYDDDVRYWTAVAARGALSESPTVTAGGLPLPIVGSAPGAVRGRRFLVVCCDNKAIIADLVTMRTKDIPKVMLDNRSPLCVEFLPRSQSTGDGPFACFGGPDGVIRVLSLATWQVTRKFTGGQKGAVHSLLTLMAANGETMLASGGADGALVLWAMDSATSAASIGSATSVTTVKEIPPKVAITKAHDGGIYCMSLMRVLGASPQLVTCGADKSVAFWDTFAFREVRRLKQPLPKMVCHTVASWKHPRVPHVDVLACAKDSHIWAIDNTGATRPLTDLASHLPPTPQITAGKKLKVYCMLPHLLQPHILVCGTNVGVIVSRFDSLAAPPAAPLPTLKDSASHTVPFCSSRGLQLLRFQLLSMQAQAQGAAGRGEGGGAAGASAVGEPDRPVTPAGALRMDALEAAVPKVAHKRERVASVAHDSFSRVSVSKSGKYVAVLWSEVPFFSVFRIADWAVMDSGAGRLFAWDSCQDRYAVMGGAVVPKVQRSSSFAKAFRRGSKKEAERAEAEKAAAMAAAAAAMAGAKVEVKRIGEKGVEVVCSNVEAGRKEQVIDLQGGALLGVACRVPRKHSVPGALVPAAAAAATSPAMPGTLANGLASLVISPESFRDAGEQPPNFYLISWESFKPVSPALPQPLWSAWDPVVEYCAFAYDTHVVVATLRPQFRCIGHVAIPGATGATWHRRQLFLVTPTTVECVFVDAGVSAIDVETRRRKAQRKRREAEAKVVREKGELALLAMPAENKEEPAEKVQLRPPMLQVVRLASFSSVPAVPPISAMARKHASYASTPLDPSLTGESSLGLLDGPEVRPPEVVVGGGGLPVAAGRLPQEQRRPMGPVVVVGVRDGVLWLVDRFFSPHAITLSHPGVRCRCLAAHGDPVGAVKWASRLSREHHDDLARFMIGMGYAREALYMPGLSKRFEYALSRQCNELHRALQCLLSLCCPSSDSSSSSYDFEADNINAMDSTGILTIAASQANMMEAAAGTALFANELLELVDAADATGHADVAMRALRQLAGASLLEGALSPEVQRELSLRLATHGDATHLEFQIAALIKAGQGREAANAAALLGDAHLLEKAWADTGMLPEAALHAQSHGRPTLKELLQKWNHLLQKEEAAVKARHLLHTAHFNTLFGNTRQSDDPFQILSPMQKEPDIQIVPPGHTPQQPSKPAFVDAFAAGVPQQAGQTAAALPATSWTLAGAAAGGSWTTFSEPPPQQLGSFMIPPVPAKGGIQGMTAPLDLNVLEGPKTLPAPQKGPSVIAVPVDFSSFEKSLNLQPKLKPAEMPKSGSTGGDAGKSVASTGSATKGRTFQGTPPRGGGTPTGPTMADLEWAALGGTSQNR